MHKTKLTVTALNQHENCLISKAKDLTAEEMAKAKANVTAFVLEDPGGQGLVLEETPLTYTTKYKKTAKIGLHMENKRCLRAVKAVYEGGTVG